jgi:cold shock CspA family protein
MDGYKNLNTGDIVTFDVVNGDKGLQADNVEVVEAAKTSGKKE